MKYNPKIHNRRSIRLKNYDYSQAGMYFITICCYKRTSRFGHIENRVMKLNEQGQIAHNEWIKLSERFPNVVLDAFQIMPNHMHGIIILTPAQTKPENKMNRDIKQYQKLAPTVGNIIGSYKSLVANGCLKIYKLENKIMGKLWQRNYWEHIIRNEKSHQRISDYIIENPENWQQDKFFKK